MKGKPRTQKQLALRRWLGGAVLLAALVLLFPVHFTPTQALDRAEAEHSTGDTTVIGREKVGKTTFLLSENRNVFLFTGYRPAFPQGWNCLRVYALDLSQGEEPVCARFCSDPVLTQVYGVTTLDEGVSVRAYTSPARAEEYGIPPSDIVWTGKIRQSEEGTRYFWLREEPSQEVGPFFHTLDILDAEGNTLYTYDLPSGGSEEKGGVYLGASVSNL